MKDTKHENYELLNLIGYGLAKFNMNFVKRFGYKTKTAFYESIVQLGIAETVDTVKNRQDLFDPFFDNGRKGWWQKGDAYRHRKVLIDSLYGSLEVHQFADIVKLHIENEFGTIEKVEKVVSPIMKSKYRQLQITGQEAEIFFMNNYQNISTFENGLIEDARMFGDGYDFQIQVSDQYFLAEVKGVRTGYGSIRLTKNEFEKANEYKNEYGLVVVSNLIEIPKMTILFDPIEKIRLTKQLINTEQVSYQSESISW
jgi:hypothetical protein